MAQPVVRSVLVRQETATTLQECAVVPWASLARHAVTVRTNILVITRTNLVYEHKYLGNVIVFIPSDCTKAADCVDIGRVECSNLTPEQTCGPCLIGFVGVVGSGNTECICE